MIFLLMKMSVKYWISDPKKINPWKNNRRPVKTMCYYFSI